MSILVAGGAGYIGSHMVALLVERGYDVVVVDNLATGHWQAVKGAKLRVGDLKDAAFPTISDRLTGVGAHPY